MVRSAQLPLLCMVDSNRLHVSTLHAGHLQAELRRTGSCPKSAIVSDFSDDISMPKFFVVFCNENGDC
jgi:hypothetical protein